MQIFYRTSITLMHPTPNTQHPEPNTQAGSPVSKVWQRYGKGMAQTSIKHQH